MGLFKNIKKKVQENKAKKASGEKKGIVQKAKEKAMLVLFAPFIAVAKVFLKRRGIVPSNDPAKLVEQVMNERSKKSFGFAPEGYEPKDVFDYDYLEGEAGMVEQMEYGFVLTAEMVMLCIQFLKTTFDAIKAKKAKGEALSADEQAIYDQKDTIEAELDEAKKKANEITESAEKEAAGGFSMKTIFIILLIVLALFFFLRR